MIFGFFAVSTTSKTNYLKLWTHQRIDVFQEESRIGSPFLYISSYWKSTTSGEPPRWPCLALPDVACPDPSASERLAWHVDRQPEDVRNIRLQQEGLTKADFRILRATLESQSQQ